MAIKRKHWTEVVPVKHMIPVSLSGQTLVLSLCGDCGHELMSGNQYEALAPWLTPFLYFLAVVNCLGTKALPARLNYMHF